MYTLIYCPYPWQVTETRLTSQIDEDTVKILKVQEASSLDAMNIDERLKTVTILQSPSVTED